jgi:replicative DNA helicase
MIQTEESLIASLLHNNQFIEETRGRLRPEDFRDLTCRAIFEHIQGLDSSRPIDALVISQRVKVIGFTADELFMRLCEIACSIYAHSDVMFLEYIRLIKEEANRKQVADLLNHTRIKMAEGSTQYLEHLKNGIVAIERNNFSTIEPYSATADQALENLEKDCMRETALTGISTGFKQLDLMTYGLQRGDLIVIAARPSVGKSMFALNIADNIGTINQQPAIFFSLEMGSKALVKRSMARFAGISGDKIFSANLTEDHRKQLHAIMPFLRGSKLFIHDKCGLSLNDIRAGCRQVKNLCGLDAIFVDYLNLIGEPEGESEAARVGAISQGLKAIAKDFDIPVIAVSQLNRNCEGRKEKGFFMSDIRGSGQIEQDADVIIFLDRSPDGIHVDAELAKNRNGSLGKISFQVENKFFEFKEEGYGYAR